MIILTGECGCGKSAIEKVLVEKYGYKRTVSYTSKEKEQDEIDGIDYNFVSFEDFTEKINNDFFVECGSNNGVFYGTTKEQYVNNTVCILTPHGLRQIKNNLEDDKINIHIFYIKVPRRDRLIKMLQRGDNIEEIIKRDKDDKTLYDGMENEVDHVLINMNYSNDPENMAYRIIECIKGDKKYENY